MAFWVLGFKEISVLGADSFFGTLISQGGPTDGELVFGLLLAESDPELIVGGTDSSKSSGRLTFTNLDTQVSILRGVPCLRFTRTLYRVSGRILTLSTEMTLRSAL